MVPRRPNRYRTKYKIPRPFSFAQSFTWNLYPAWQHDSTLRRIRLLGPFPTYLGASVPALTFSFIPFYFPSLSLSLLVSRRTLFSEEKFLVQYARQPNSFITTAESLARRSRPGLAHSRERNEPRVRGGRRDKKALRSGRERERIRTAPRRERARRRTEREEGVEEAEKGRTKGKRTKKGHEENGDEKGRKKRRREKRRKEERREGEEKNA